MRFSPTVFDWEHFLPHEVAYSRQRPRLPMSSEDMNEWIQAALLTKAEQWRYEREWRTFDVDGPGYHSFRPSMLDGVILGALIEPIKKELIVNYIKSRSPVSTKIFQASIESRDFVVSVSEV